MASPSGKIIKTLTGYEAFIPNPLPLALNGVIVYHALTIC